MRVFVPSRQTSAKDMASHTQLKFRQAQMCSWIQRSLCFFAWSCHLGTSVSRQEGQGSAKELDCKDFKAALLEKESKHFKDTHRRAFEGELRRTLWDFGFEVNK
jgi:Cwf15/Cwc15 cell cycle control protein